MNVAANEHPFELGRLAHEFEVFRRRAKSHHPLDTGTVVPGSVEEHDLTGRRQVSNIALEVPLGLLTFRRLLQRHHSRTPWIQVLGESLDRAALSRRIAPFEKQHHFCPESFTQLWSFNSSICRLRLARS